jgi:hypothetical protein
MWRCRPINNTNSYEIIRYKARWNA